MSNTRFQLKNARLSFPSLFNKPKFNGETGKKFEATFLVDKSDTKTKDLIDKHVSEALAEARVKDSDVNASNRCIRDGDDKPYDGYENVWSFKAGSTKRPIVINVDKSAVTEEDGVLYAGCYVNAIVDIWIQNNGFGKKVNANLYGVQFVKDGDPFGSGAGTDVTDDFDDLEDL